MSRFVKQQEDLNQDGVIDEKDFELQEIRARKNRGLVDDFLDSPMNMLSPLISDDLRSSIKEVGVGAYSNVARQGINLYNWVANPSAEDRANTEANYRKTLEALVGENYVTTEERDNGEQVVIIKRPEGIVGNIAREMGGFGVGLQAVDKVNDARKYLQTAIKANKNRKQEKSFSAKRPIVAGTLKAEAAIQISFDPMQENMADLILNMLGDKEEERGLIAKYILEPMSTKEDESEARRRLKMLGEGLLFTGVLAAPFAAGRILNTLDDIKLLSPEKKKAWLEKIGIKINDKDEIIQIATLRRSKLEEQGKVPKGKGDFKGLDETPLGNNGFLRNLKSKINRIFTPQGDKTISMHEKYLKTLNAKEKYIATITHTTQRLEEAIEKVLGQSGFKGVFKFENVDDLAKRDELMDKINKVLFDNKLAGKSPKAKKEAFAKLLKTLPEDIRQPVLEMRKIQDNLSKLMMKSDIITEGQKKIFKENLGEYVRTSYKFYEQAGYRPPKSVEKEALKFIEDTIRSSNKRKLTDIEIKQEAQAQLKAILNRGGGADGASQFYNALDNFSKINKRFFNGKKELALPIRKLLGEIDKPIDKFISSTTKIINAVEDAKLYDELYQESGGILFHSKPVGTFTEQIPEGFGKLSGKYTTPELKQYYSYKRKYLTDDQGPLGTVYRTLSLLKGVSQSSKTVLSHATHVKNVVGGVQMSLANGTNPFDVDRILTTVNALRRKDKEGRQFYEELTELGIVNKGVVASDLRGLADDIAKSGSKNPLLYILNNKGSRFAQNVYIAEDDFFKINMYLGELQHLQKVNKARPENMRLSDKALKEEAARSVRDTLPNYDLVPELLKDLRRLPFFGRFFSFMAESVRISVNSVKRGVREMKEGTRLIDQGAKEAGLLVRDRGGRRLAAFGTVAGGGALIAQKASQGLMGIDQEQADALRQIGMPDYMQNSKVLYGPGPDGEPVATNLSSWDAYDFPKKGLDLAILAALNEPDDGTPNYAEDKWLPKIIEFLWTEMAAPFIGESLVQEVVNDYFIRDGIRGSSGTDMGMPPTVRNLARATGNDEFALQRLNRDENGKLLLLDKNNLTILTANLFEQLVPGTITSTARWYNNQGKEQTKFDQDIYETNEMWKFLTGFGGTPLNREYLENQYKYKISKYSKQKNQLSSNLRSGTSRG